MKLTYFIAALLASTATWAQPGAAEGTDSPPPANIEQLRWLVGHWEGRGLGGRSIETISPPLAGQIAGHFQQTDARGQIQFFEFYQFAEVEGSLVLRIRHFRPDLTGWEAERPQEFRLTSIAPNAVTFQGVTFRLAGPGRLVSDVVMQRREGESRISFEFDSIDLTPRR